MGTRKWRHKVGGGDARTAPPSSILEVAHRRKRRPRGDQSDVGTFASEASPRRAKRGVVGGPGACPRGGLRWGRAGGIVSRPDLDQTTRPRPTKLPASPGASCPSAGVVAQLCGAAAQKL